MPQHDAGRRGRGGAPTRRSRSRSGIGRRFGVNENVCVSRGALPALEVHRDEHGDEEEEVDQPGLVEEVEADERPAATPMAMPATNARGNDTMPAITAAASARTSVLGPSDGEVGGRAGLRRRSARSRASTSAPATAHTNGDTSFGLMPARRARSRVLGRRLDALAERRAVEEPARGRPRRAARRSGSTSCGPVIRTSPTVVRGADRAAGTGRPARRSRGSATRIASESWAMPIVATSTITAGRVEQPADHGELDERAVQRADDERRRRAEPVRHVVLRRPAARTGRRRRGPCCRRRS